jgi:hypothetical protein
MPCDIRLFDVANSTICPSTAGRAASEVQYDLQIRARPADEIMLRSGS